MCTLILRSFAFGDDGPGAATAIELFQRRIMPIFRSPQPASCVQCHLASVDLKDYILPSHEKTFVSLRDQGLINLDRPSESKILTLIQMGEKDLDQGAKLIHAQTRKAEYEAFAAWIAACCNDPKLRELPALAAAERARPARPDAVIRHARKSRLVDSFVRNVWSQRMRCFPCHTPHELDESDPKLRPAIKRHKEFLAAIGEEYAARMNIFRETPEATLDYLISSSQSPRHGELPLINIANPRESLLVLKPTAKVPTKRADGKFEKPSYQTPVSHMGGLKMHVDDQSYKAFVAWIEDYARVVGDKYTSVEQLPADNWFASKHVLMVREVPATWTAMSRVQLFVHAWDEQAQAWSSEPIAFTQGTVTPVKNIVGALFVFGPKDGRTTTKPDPENARLAPGKYLVKAYRDSKNQLADDPTIMLGPESFAGQAEIQAQWGEGFPQAERIPGSLIQ
jgi:hypothetical protein